MRDALPEIRSRGAELVILGNGQPAQAADFRDSEHVQCPLVVDPDLKAYAAAGLKRGVLSSFNVNVARNAARALFAGKRQGATQGDPWQQGGVFIIQPGNRTSFAYISEEAGDHPDPAKVIAALDRSNRQRQRRQSGDTVAPRARR